MILKVKKITKTFHSLKAVDNVSFQIKKGEISSIIGPNGAGKTTIFNLLTGHLRLDKGRIIFQEEKINDLSPNEICKKGIGRSFQKTNIFPLLSVFDNVHVAVISRKGKSNNIFLRADKIFREEANEILNRIGLYDKKDIQGGLLAHGDQRRLEVGIGLGTQPKLLLLDEPTAGMSPEETYKTVELIKILASERDISILFIEHDMSVVFGISKKVMVMHQGRIIAEGTPEKIKDNAEVQKIYLGEAI